MSYKKNNTELTILCWQGYKGIQESFKEELDDLNLTLNIVEDLNSDRIYSSFYSHRRRVDIVIVDYEYRRYYSDFVYELDDNIVKKIQYLKPFHDSSYYEVDGRLLYIPIRFGTNGFIYRLQDGCRNETNRFKLSLSKIFANYLKEEENNNIGVWDWWLPNMVLLAKSEGFKYLSDMTKKQLEEIYHDGSVIKSYINCLKKQKLKTSVFNSLSDIIHNELDKNHAKNRIDFILGPSEMVVAPICCAQKNRDDNSTLNWNIPKDGGLVWLETAAISKFITKEKLDAAKRLLCFFQSESIQRALMCGGIKAAINNPNGHWSYALNNKKGLEKIPMDLKSDFRNQYFSREVDVFSDWISKNINTDLLTLRRLPEDHEIRRLGHNIWKGILHQASLA